MSWRAWALGVAAGALWSPAVVRADGGAALVCEVRGRVADRHGLPVPGADIIVTRSDGSGRRAAISDDDGHFTLPAADAGALRVLVIAGRGARVATQIVVVAPGAAVTLQIQDDPSGGTIEVSAAVTSANAGSTLTDEIETTWAIPALSRQGDLGGAITALPGTAPAAAPAGAPVISGLPLAEVPVAFEGFSLSDPVDGDVPVEFPMALLGAVSISTEAVPEVDLRAPLAVSTRTRVTGGLAGTAGARGADDLSRPAGTTAGWDASLRFDPVWRTGRARATVGVAPQSQLWESDPHSVRDPRGHRRRLVPALAWGAFDVGEWQMRGGALFLHSATDHGRGGHILAPGDPVDGATHARRWLLVGARADRSLGTGDNAVGLAVGLLDTARTDNRAGFAETEASGWRGNIAATLRLGASLGGEHQIGTSAGLDFDAGRIDGPFASRQVGVILNSASAQTVRPFAALTERYSPSVHFDAEAGLLINRASFSGKAAAPGATAALSRSFASKILLAPHVRVSFRPLLGPRTLALQASVGRSPGKTALWGLMDATAAPRSSLSLSSQDAVTVAADFTTARGRVGAIAQARRESNVIEDRFAAVTGQPEFFSPAGARRNLRALTLDGELRWSRVRFGAAGVLAQLSGNHTGAIDEATGQLRPWSTAAFDGPDVEVNRSGPLPFDRPFGVRAFASTVVAPVIGWRLSALARGRVDGGTPLSATGRSLVSGEGEVFLGPRGSVGRTRSHTSFDFSLKLARAVGQSEAYLAVEGFGLAWRHPIVARDLRYSDAVATAETPSGLEPRPGYGRAVAYAEPFALRLRLGVDF